MRIVSDGDLNTSGSSTDSVPRQRSAEHVRRPTLEGRFNKNSRKGTWLRILWLEKLIS